ncbi:DUF6307 family protein [Actinosynnema sp. CS-041913]|uniref:DUF6307 family protein n=1 Tax=Actinosynnema sp. CS-041913 TaxID=3239917 RepID=UPI003D93CAAD
MTALFVSRYEARIDLVQKTLRDHSKLDEKAAAALAVQVLRALDGLPEQVR